MKAPIHKLAALGSKPRLRILEALRDRQLECSDPEGCDVTERCCNVGELAERVNLRQPTVSHHLKELKRAELIETRKEGRTVYCQLREKGIEQVISFLEHLRTKKENNP